MLIEVRVPILAESVAEATLIDWHKQPGDAVKFGDTLIDIETDKVTLEVVAPEDGMLVKILKNGGEDVTSNELIAEIDTDADASAPGAEAETEDPPVVPDPVQQDDVEEPEPAPSSVAETARESGQQSLLAEIEDAAPGGEDAEPATGKAAPAPKLSPAVRNLLREHDLNAEDIPVQGDRLTKKAVLDYLQDNKAAPTDGEPAAHDTQQTPATEDTPAPVAGAELDPPPSPREEGEGRSEEETQPRNRQTSSTQQPDKDAEPLQAGEQRVPMTRLRRRAAERLLAAQQENAILTTFNEVNMKPVMDLRRRYKDSFEKTHEVKLGFMSFFTKAAVEALKKFPLINASVDGADIIYHDYFDIGIAVSSPRGLVVPVIRAADQLSFADIEKTISDYGRKAHDAKLTIADLTGGTFTITNGGVFGSLLSTPIINPPQSAILGMHKIEERPIAEDGAVVVRPMMYLALSYDHRIIDGREAVSFLVAVKEALEDPSRLLLQI